MYRLIDHKQNILRPKGDQSFHTVCAKTRPFYVTHFCPKSVNVKILKFCFELRVYTYLSLKIRNYKLMASYFYSQEVENRCWVEKRPAGLILNYYIYESRQAIAPKLELY